MRLSELPTNAAAATSLFVATNGSDSDPGTQAAPLKAVQKAVDRAQPGDTIHLRGGTYAPSTNIRILKNGTASAPITMRNYDNERVIIDGENMPYTPTPTGPSRHRTSFAPHNADVGARFQGTCP